MNNIFRFLLILILIVFSPIIFYGQTPTISFPNISSTSSIISVTNNVDYSIGGLTKDDLAFILFGDGTYGFKKNGKHTFLTNTTNNVRVYSAGIYKPTKPTRPPNTASKFITISSGTSAIDTSNLPPNLLSRNSNPNIGIYNSWAPVPGEDVIFIIAYKNPGFSVLENRIELQYNSSQMTIHNSAIGVVGDVNSRKDWIASLLDNQTGIINCSFNSPDYKSMDNNEVRYIYVKATIKATIKIGYNINLTATLHYDNSPPSSETANFMTRQYPHDPNYKIVDKQCIDSHQPDEKLVYTVGFFNDGEAKVKDVLLTDNLPAELNPNTFKVIDSKDQRINYTKTISNNRVMVEFEDINLSGIQQKVPRAFSYDQCSFWFKFEIYTFESLTREQTCIENEIAIIFDGELPVNTNKAYTYVTENCMEIADNISCGNEISTEEPYISVSPNPFNEIIHVDIEFQEEISFIEIYIVDLHGNIVQHLYNTDTLDSVNESFQIDELQQGVYILLIKTPENQYTRQIIKD